MRVSKWVNSLAVRLPKALVERLALKQGDALNVVAIGNDTIAVETKAAARLRALDHIRTRYWTLPAKFKFDREEANER